MKKRGPEFKICLKVAFTKISNINKKEIDSESDLDPFEAFRLAEQDEAVRAFNKQEK